MIVQKFALFQTLTFYNDSDFLTLGPDWEQNEDPGEADCSNVGVHLWESTNWIYNQNLQIELINSTAFDFEMTRLLELHTSHKLFEFLCTPFLAKLEKIYSIYVQLG